MNFGLSTEQAQLRDVVRKFCAARYGFADRKRYLSMGDGFDPANWQAFADLGWLAAALPEDAGGTEDGPISAAIVLEEFGRALVLEPYLSHAVLAARAINAGAAPERRRQLLAELVGGRCKFALAHEEPGSWGFEREVHTCAIRDGRGFTLTGRKVFVLGGPTADRLIISARLGDGPPLAQNVGLFLVPAGCPGLHREDHLLLDGTRASDVSLRGVSLAEEALLCAGTGALEALAEAARHGIVAVCAMALGAMQSALYATRDYLKSRKQYGTALASLQALQHRMADMYVELELSRSMLYRALAALCNFRGEILDDELACAKVKICSAGLSVAAEAIQLHGAMGMCDDVPVGHQFRQLTVLERFLGCTDFHLQRLGRHAAPSRSV